VKDIPAADGDVMVVEADVLEEQLKKKLKPWDTV
jgi:hypothetical protein